MSKSDEELMRDFQIGNETSFVTLYERYKLAIYRFLYRKLGHQARAEDLTQEVFVALVEHRKEWRQESSFKTYLYRIAHNRAISEMRRSEYKVMVEADNEANTEKVAKVATPNTSPSASVEQKQLQVKVQQALTMLDKEYREPIVLREYEDLSYEEISLILEIPVGTVKSRIFRGKVELKRLLEPMLTTTSDQVLKPPNIGSPPKISGNMRT
ncbi:MAG: RNA polymerase sigma factor [Acidobacteria bacterium]|nr:RNA polymerase sigma factor [Acidobacteriota bacterium]